MKWIYSTPEGQYSTLYRDMLEQPHLLIAGATGSGKSVVVNGIMSTALYHSPAAVQFILIDMKFVELSDYRRLPHTLQYAETPAQAVAALQRAVNLSMTRYKDMQRRHLKKYDGSAVYVVIDELADLMTTSKRQVQPLIQRLCQIGRAANIHVIAATQCPLAAVIPTPIKVNFDSRVALRTSCAQDSRNILGRTGCELLPDPETEKRGEGYYKHGCKIEHYNIPKIPESEIARLVDYWRHARPRFQWR